MAKKTLAKRKASPRSRLSGAKIDWQRIEALPAFKELLRSKAAFVVPACVFFVAYYFALPVLVGYFPDFMKTEVWGPVNLAYAFALSQFFMAWAIAWLYVKAAGRTDRQNDALLASLEGRARGRR